MGRVCLHADIQTRPCAGSVFSRAIKCKAGQSNTCLRDCGEKCPAYKPEGGRERTYSFAPSMPAQTFSSRQESRAPRQPTFTATTGGGCGGCGKMK